jgi:hypothetical protein
MLILKKIAAREGMEVSADDVEQCIREKAADFARRRFLKDGTSEKEVGRTLNMYRKILG